jgi:hypothetical protein
MDTRIVHEKSCADYHADDMTYRMGIEEVGLLQKEEVTLRRIKVCREV